MKVGLIGSSPICKFHISALQKNGFIIDAVGSRHNSSNCLDLCNQFSLQEKYCKNGWEEVLNKNVDAFIISIDIGVTPQILEKALLTGKYILVEKPISWDPKIIKSISNMKNSDKIFVGYNRRFYKTVNELKNYCKKLAGGTIVLNIPDSTPGIKQFISNGCHVIDTLRYLIGDFTIIKSLVVNDDADDILSITAICENEKWKIIMNAHSKIPSNFSITINSNERVFELKPIERLSLYDGIDIIEPTIDDPIRKYVPSLKKTVIESSELKPGFDEMYKSFKKFLNGNFNENLCTINDALLTSTKCWEFVEDKLPKNL